MKKNKRNVLRTLCITAFSAILLAGALTGCAKGNASEEKEIKDTANAIFTAFAEQDADALDRYMPDSGMGSFVYNDPEGFKMYTSRMAWEITGVEKDGEETEVQMKITNVDMVQIIEENPQAEGAQMPDATPEQIAAAGTKTFDYTLPLKKAEDGYQMALDSSDMEASMEKISDLLNVITGGGFSYLASLEGPDESYGE